MLDRDKERPVILYFIDNGVPTDEDYNALDRIAAATKGYVRFRNGGAAVVENDTLEVCNGVAGENIPAKYRAKYPVVDADGNSSMPLSAIQANEDKSVSASVAAEVGNANDPVPPANPPVQAQGFGGFGSFSTNQ